jgi:hypothetical protein
MFLKMKYDLLNLIKNLDNYCLNSTTFKILILFQRVKREVIQVIPIIKLYYGTVFNL